MCFNTKSLNGYILSIHSFASGFRFPINSLIGVSDFYYITLVILVSLYILNGLHTDKTNYTQVHLDIFQEGMLSYCHLNNSINFFQQFYYIQILSLGSFCNISNRIAFLFGLALCLTLSDTGSSLFSFWLSVYSESLKVVYIHEAMTTSAGMLHSEYPDLKPLSL